MESDRKWLKAQTLVLPEFDLIQYHEEYTSLGQEIGDRKADLDGP